MMTIIRVIATIAFIVIPNISWSEPQQDITDRVYETETVGTNQKVESKALSTSNKVSPKDVGIAPWLAAIGTLILAFVAIFQDRIRSYIASPKLNVEIDTATPYCQKIKVLNERGGAQADGYFIRLCVVNGSKIIPAREVEVFVEELLKKGIDGNFHSYELFDPACLIWSHSFAPHTNLSPGMKRYCFIGRIIKPSERGNFPRFQSDNVPADKTCLSFATEVERHTKPHIVPAGEYLLRCLIGGSNSKAIEKHLKIDISGDWYDAENDMFRSGLKVKLDD